LQRRFQQGDDGFGRDDLAGQARAERVRGAGQSIGPVDGLEIPVQTVHGRAQATSARVAKKRTDGPIRQPRPVWKVATSAPQGTSLRSVAARPAETPLTVPARPPNTIAERGVLSTRKRAAMCVPTITMIAFTRP